MCISLGGPIPEKEPPSNLLLHSIERSHRMQEKEYHLRGNEKAKAHRKAHEPVKTA